MSEGEDAQDGADEQPEGVAAEPINQAVESGHATVETSVEKDADGNPYVTRTAAFAEVADRPKRKALDDEKRKSDIEFRDDLRKFDAELSGTIRAIIQSAAAGMTVTHPAIEGERTEMDEIEKKITKACHDLLDKQLIQQDAETYFRNAIVQGDDVSHVEYEDIDTDGEGGVTDMTPLPLRILTIVDNETRNNGYATQSGTEDGFRTEEEFNTSENDYENLITEADWYVLLEDNDDKRQEFPASDILHISLDKRGNWEEDRLGRLTYNVWGESRLEPVKYPVQAKQNTLANKVAMDDKLLTREYFYINVEELFGHIEDPDQRQSEVESYATDLRQKLEDLDSDQKPILPEEVEVKIEGPQGETARNQVDFIGLMNDSIQHALNFHVTAFGRDAGGTDRANKPAKEMSENTVRQIRDTVKTAFRDLFEIHAKLRFNDAREDVPPGELEPHQEGTHAQYALADDIVLPTLKFDPVDPEDRNDEVRNAATIYEKGIGDVNEARAEVDLEPIDESDRDDRMWHPEKNPTTLEEDQEMQESPSGPGDGEGPDDDSNGPNESPNDEPTESRPSRPTNSSEDEDPRTERSERVGDET